MSGSNAAMCIVDCGSGSSRRQRKRARTSTMGWEDQYDDRDETAAEAEETTYDIRIHGSSSNGS